MQRQARYDIAVNTPPIGYQPSPTKLMFGQMWEKRSSGGFEILIARRERVARNDSLFYPCLTPVSPLPKIFCDRSFPIRYM
jgi:hypothetical protein